MSFHLAGPNLASRTVPKIPRARLDWRYLLLLPIPFLWALLGHYEYLDRLENHLLDLRFRARGEIEAPVKLIYVDVDTRSVQEIGELPWSREKFALAAQARIALRGAAERAAALGSYEQARTFLEQALEVTTEPTERADLHTRALQVASHVLDAEPVLHHAAAAVAERRKTGDREAIAIAAAKHVQAVKTYRADPVEALRMVEALWAEFSDLEQTAAGVALMSSYMRAYRGIGLRISLPHA